MKQISQTRTGWIVELDDEELAIVRRALGEADVGGRAALLAEAEEALEDALALVRRAAGAPAVEGPPRPGPLPAATIGGPAASTVDEATWLRAAAGLPLFNKFTLQVDGVELEARQYGSRVLACAAGLAPVEIPVGDADPAGQLDDRAKAVLADVARRWKAIRGR